VQQKKGSPLNHGTVLCCPVIAEQKPLIKQVLPDYKALLIKKDCLLNYRLIAYLCCPCQFGYRTDSAPYLTLENPGYPNNLLTSDL